MRLKISGAILDDINWLINAIKNLQTQKGHYLDPKQIQGSYLSI